MRMNKDLEYAIEEDNVPVVEALLDEKPQRINQRGTYGRTLLMVALSSRNRSMNCLRALIDAGSDVNARSQGGNTPLHWVIQNEYYPPHAASSDEIVVLLLEAGADIEDDQNMYQFSPLARAVAERLPSTARLLLARGANPNRLYNGRPLISLAWLQPRMLNVLIEGGADVNLRDDYGQTAEEYFQNLATDNYEVQKQECLTLLRQAASPS